MPGLRGPLFSLTASGRLTRALTLARRLTGSGWLLRGRPADPRTEPQLTWRTMWQLAASLWHQLSAAEQAAWERDATPRSMTGYAWYMSQALRPNPGIYLPLAGGTMSGHIDMNGNMLEDLPAPAAPGDAARKAYVDALQGEHSWMAFRRLSNYHFTSPQRSYWNALLAANRLYATPFYSPFATTVTAIGVYVGTGSAGNARLGIYDDGTNLHPGTLLSDCGAIDTTVLGIKTLSPIAVDLAANTLYWLAIVTDATPSLYSLDMDSSWNLLGATAPLISNTGGSWTHAQAYGALPDPFPSPATLANDNGPTIGVLLT